MRAKKHLRYTLLIVFVLIAALVLAACGGEDEDNNGSSDNDDANTGPRTYTTLTVQDAHTQSSADENAIIVDVREPQEWAATGVPEGATLITLGTVTSSSGAVDGLPKDQPIYVICNSGNRSRVASEHLINLGYQTVYNVDGGIQAWMRASLPTEPYTP